jgi:hypothetical protein
MGTPGSAPPQGSPFSPKDELRIAQGLPAGADRTAVLRALAELADHVNQRRRSLAQRLGKLRLETEWHAVSPRGERDCWKRVEKSRRRFTQELRSYACSFLLPKREPAWFLPTLQYHEDLAREFQIRTEALNTLVRARSRGYDVYGHIILDALLRIWTDVAGGKLQYSRDRVTSGVGGPLIRFLAATLEILLGRVPFSLSALAVAIDEERKRRRHTESEKKRRLRGRGERR